MLQQRAVLEADHPFGGFGRVKKRHLDGKDIVGIGYCNILMAKQLITLCKVGKAQSRAGVVLLFGAYDVAYAESVTVCRFEMYCERITAADNIVFQCVLYQQLYTDGYDVMVYQVMVDVVLEAQILAVAYGHHLAVGLGELQLLLECHEALALHYVASRRAAAGIAAPCRRRCLSVR